MNERESALLDLEHEVGRLVRRLKRVVGERARLVHPDLSPAAYLMLAHLVDKGPMRSADVVEAFDLDKGAVSRHVQTLVDLGLVARDRDPDDGRAQVLTPTATGRHRLADAVAQRRVRFGRLLAEWPDDDLRGFVGSLARYNQALSAD